MPLDLPDDAGTAATAHKCAHALSHLSCGRGRCSRTFVLGHSQHLDRTIASSPYNGGYLKRSRKAERPVPLPPGHAAAEAGHQATSRAERRIRRAYRRLTTQRMVHTECPVLDGHVLRSLIAADERVLGPGDDAYFSLSLKVVMWSTRGCWIAIRARSREPWRLT
jgi:hypothetical protein